MLLSPQHASRVGTSAAYDWLTPGVRSSPIMRLINVKTRLLEEFLDDNVPAYAILSHTWGVDHEELHLNDFRNNHTTKLNRSRKFEGSCSQASMDGFEYIWIDTCCIDRESSTELSEAINSMFRWYKDAEVCYAYLSDVDIGDGSVEPSFTLGRSRWLTRGWTLQELLAPKTIRFYDKKWTCIGSKRELAHVLVDITGIPQPFLLGRASLRDASVAQRMSWASTRKTKRKEDMAYCLLGIFDISMPMIYGEGDRAFLRLQEHIMRHIRDDSILSWGFRSPGIQSTGALAKSPSDFATCGDIVSNALDFRIYEPMQIVGGRLQFRRSSHRSPSGQTFVVLLCRLSGNTTQPLGMPFQNRQVSGFIDGHERPSGEPVVLLEEYAAESQPSDIRIDINPREDDRSYGQWDGIYIDNTLESSVRVLEVMPPTWWNRETDMIMPTSQILDDNTQTTCIRLRQIGVVTSPSDFLVTLDLRYNRFIDHESPQKSTIGYAPGQSSGNDEGILDTTKQHIRFHAMVCGRDTDTAEVLRLLEKMDPTALGKSAASNGLISLRAELRIEQAGSRENLVLRLSRASFTPPTTTDASYVLRQIRTEANLIEVFQKDYEFFLSEESIAKKLKSKAADLNQDVKRLADVGKRIRTLEEQQRSLRDTIAASSREMKQINTERVSLREKRAELSSAADGICDKLDMDYQDRLAKTLITKWYHLFVGKETGVVSEDDRPWALTEQRARNLVRDSANSITLLALRYIRKRKHRDLQIRIESASSGKEAPSNPGKPGIFSLSESPQELSTDDGTGENETSGTFLRPKAISSVAGLRKLFSR